MQTQQIKMGNILKEAYKPLTVYTMEKELLYQD
jgi:hypothetical protein